MRRWILMFALLFALVVVSPAQEVARSERAGIQSSGEHPTVLRMDLAKAIELAFQNNNRSKISKDDIDASVALHGQALSSWWPKISASISGSRMDEDPNFIFPASNIPIPASTYTVPSTTILLPANSFGPGLPPVNVPLSTPSTDISIPAQTIQIPKQDVKIMDRDILVGSVKATLPIYTGGLRGARIRQAKQGIEIARQDERQNRKKKMATSIAKSKYYKISYRRRSTIWQGRRKQAASTLRMPARRSHDKSHFHASLQDPRGGYGAPSCHGSVRKIYSHPAGEALSASSHNLWR